MNRPNEYYAYFTVTGDFDPTDISTRLGLQPTDSWKIGELHQNTKLERKFSRWSLYTRLDHTLPLEQHVDDIIQQLKPFSKRIVEMREELEAWVQLVGFFHNDYPGFTFESTMLVELASMKLGLDLDFYYLYSDQREDS